MGFYPRGKTAVVATESHIHKVSRRVWGQSPALMKLGGFLDLLVLRVLEGGLYKRGIFLLRLGG